jgi:hypothetical protein
MLKRAAVNLERHFKKRTFFKGVMLLFTLGSLLLMSKCNPKSTEICDELTHLTDVCGQVWDGTQLIKVKYEIENLNDRFIVRYEEPVAFAFIKISSNILDKNPEYFLMQFVLKGKEEFIYGIRVYKVLGTGPGAPFKGSQTVFFFHRGKDRPDFLRLDVYNLKDFVREPQVSEVVTDSIQFFTSNASLVHAYTNLIREIHIFELRAVYASEGITTSRPVDDQLLMLSIGCYIGLMVLLPITYLSLGKIKIRKLLNVKVILIVGVALRVALSIFTAHIYDMEIWKFAVRTFYEHGEIALFSNWSSPPIFYFALILFYFPYAILHYYAGFNDWRVFFLPVRAVESLFIKLPMIIADACIFLLLIKIICHLKPNIGKDRIVFLSSLYFLNPYTIMISSAWGMFDPLAAAFIVAGIYMWEKERHLLACSLFALSACTKWIGVIPLLFGILLLLRSKRFKEAIQTAITSIILILTIFALPYLISSQTNLFLEVLSFRLGQGSDVLLWHGITYLEYFRGLDVFSILPSWLVSNYFFITFGIFSVYLCLIAIRSRPKNRHSETLTLIKLTLLAFLGFYLTYHRINEQFLIWSIALLPLILLGNEESEHPASNWIGIITIIALGWTMMEATTGQTLTYMLIGFPNPLFTLQPQRPYQAGFSLVFSFLCMVLIWRLTGISEQLGNFLFYRKETFSNKRATIILAYAILLLSLCIMTWTATESIIARITPSLGLALTIYLFFVAAPLTAVFFDRLNSK